MGCAMLKLLRGFFETQLDQSPTRIKFFKPDKRDELGKIKTGRVLEPIRVTL